MPRPRSLVLDAAPSISLAAAGGLDWLPRIGVRLLVAEEVHEEIVGGGRHPESPGAMRIQQLIDKSQITVAQVRDRGLLARIQENPRLSAADAASLCLAVERGDVLVADDRDLRAAGRLMGAELGGSLYALALAVDKGLLSPREAVVTVERMISAGWYCSPALLRSFSESMRGKGPGD